MTAAVVFRVKGVAIPVPTFINWPGLFCIACSSAMNSILFDRLPCVGVALL
jgi:hypothetical protein